jgi:hypothetical protein
MKKLLALLIFFLISGCASFGSVKATPRWERTGEATLHTGFYLVCNQFDPEEHPRCTVLIAEGTQAEMDAIVEELNKPPILAPESEAYWFFWDIDTWLKIDSPFKYVP